MLHLDAAAQEPRPVQILHGVIRVSSILELAEPVGSILVPLIVANLDK